MQIEYTKFDLQIDFTNTNANVLNFEFNELIKKKIGASDLKIEKQNTNIKNGPHSVQNTFQEKNGEKSP